MTCCWEILGSQCTSGFSGTLTFFSFLRSSRLLMGRAGDFSSGGSLPKLGNALLVGLAIERVGGFIVELGRRPADAMVLLWSRRIR